MSHSDNPAKAGRLLSVPQARAAMLAAVRPLGTESVSLQSALGRVLAQDIAASRDQPPFAASAMDGYALRSSDTPGRLLVVGESAAGRGFQGVCESGAAVRVSTGAAVPDGADTVVIQEDVKRDGEYIVVPNAPAAKNIRPRGGDFTAGTVLLRIGRRLDGVSLSLVAATGAAQMLAARPPRIAILSSGDELAIPGSDPGPFQIFESGTTGIAGLIQAWGGIANRLAVAKDDVAAIAGAAEQGLKGSDLLVVIGGASVGEHDHARPALMRLGLTLAVEKIAMRPGKPTWFGAAPQGLVLGLPGNPASALVCAALFLRPLMEAMLGRDPHHCIAMRRARLEQNIPANGPREHYLRARLDVDGDGQQTVHAFEDQDSSLISVFAAANALICLPAGAPALTKGATVDVLPLEAF